VEGKDGKRKMSTNTRTTETFWKTWSQRGSEHEQPGGHKKKEKKRKIQNPAKKKKRRASPRSHENLQKRVGGNIMNMGTMEIFLGRNGKEERVDGRHLGGCQPGLLSQRRRGGGKGEGQGENLIPLGLLSGSIAL